MCHCSIKVIFCNDQPQYQHTAHAGVTNRRLAGASGLLAVLCLCLLRPCLYFSNPLCGLSIALPYCIVSAVMWLVRMYRSVSLSVPSVQIVEIRGRKMKQKKRSGGKHSVTYDDSTCNHSVDGCRVALQVHALEAMLTCNRKRCRRWKCSGTLVFSICSHSSLC